MKHLTNEQITAVSTELDMIRDAHLKNSFVANIEGRKEDADRHMAHATAMHWAIQKLMEDWVADKGPATLDPATYTIRSVYYYT